MVHEDPLLSAIFKNHLSNNHCGRWPDCGHLEAHVQQRCRGHYLRPFYLIERGSKPGDCHRRRTLQQICWQVHHKTINATPSWSLPPLAAVKYPMSKDKGLL